MLILSKTSRKSDANRAPNFIINNFFNDAFFLKGLGKYDSIFFFWKKQQEE